MKLRSETTYWKYLFTFQFYSQRAPGIFYIFAVYDTVSHLEVTRHLNKGKGVCIQGFKNEITGIIILYYNIPYIHCIIYSVYYTGIFFYEFYALWKHRLNALHMCNTDQYLILVYFIFIYHAIVKLYPNVNVT